MTAGPVGDRTMTDAGTPAGHDGARLHHTPGVRLDADRPPDAATAATAAAAAAAAEEVLAGLRRQARELIAELTGPVRRIRLRSGPTVLEVEWYPVAPPAGPSPAVATPPSDGRPTPTNGVPTTLIRPSVPGRTTVRAPIVGTFYRAPEPGAAPFVAVGDLVRPGQPVAIVEAMKLMNEVVADRAGRVVAVLVDDGQLVEFDQPLVELDSA
ncbi:hypothetical protein GCM10027614_12480 [Micromonospora vulcania]